jgi:protein SCO1/2
MNRAGILLALLLTSSLPVAAQEGDDFGITEKIGNQVPLDLTFTDEFGDKVVFGDLVDRPVVMSLVYFKCPGICTPVLDGMVYTLERVNAEPGEDFIAITISFDPEEGPELARQKKKNYLEAINRPFPSDAWRWLTADKETIEKLTTAVGFEYKKEGVEFRHAGSLIILTPEGKISRYMYGTRYLPVHVEMAIGQAKNEETSPTVAKTLEYCFTEDPPGRIMALKLISMGGSVVLGLACCLFVWLLIRRGSRPKEGKE